MEFSQETLSLQTGIRQDRQKYQVDVNTSSRHDTLFLHGGPGFNAHVERMVLSARFPNIKFWDQPPIHTTRNAFDLLIDTVEMEVNKMSDELDRPIRLMANSFGAHLVTGLLKRVPQRISSCRILGAVYDIPAAYLNLLGVMANHANPERDQSEQLRAFIRKQGKHPADSNKIWEYLNLIVSDMDFMRHYWPNRRQYLVWSDWVRRGPGFDFTTLQNVLNDFLQNHCGTAFSYTGLQNITVELGDKDPLLDLENEMRLWSRTFPNAEMIIHRGSGHFIHLEPYI